MRPDTRIAGTLSEQTTLLRAVAAVKGAFLRIATGSTKPQHDKYIENLYRRVSKKAVTLGEHELALAFNAFQRGAPLCDLEAPAWAYLTHVREWVAVRDGEPTSDDLVQLCRDETNAQGYADLEQWDLVNPTSKDLAEADDALSVHIVTLLRLRDAVRRRRYLHEQAA
jgi:hypothetical protein